MSSMKLVKFLSLTLAPETQERNQAPEPCHMCKREGSGHCSLCGKGICLMHAVRKTIETRGKTVICDQCDRHSTKVSLRRRLENAVKGLGDSLQQARAEGRSLREETQRLTDELDRKATAMSDTVEPLEEHRRELEDRLREALERRDVAQSRVTALQSSITQSCSAECTNDQSSLQLEAEFGSVSSALEAELARRSELSLLLQEYQSQLRRSVPPAVIQVKCCPRCKSITQFAFKKQHFDLFPSRLEIYESPLQTTTPQSTEKEARTCALF